MKTQTLLNIMFFLAWFVFIALLIKTGSILFSYVVSLFNIEAAKHLYFDIDWSAYSDYSFVHYSLLVHTKIVLLASQSCVAYLMTELLKELNIKKPFSTVVVSLMEKICFNILFIWVITIIHNAHLKALESVVNVPATYTDESYILWSALVYVLAQIFKRGIELQNEKDLTV